MKMKQITLAIALVALFSIPPESFAGKRTTGLGSNLHRRFVIKRTEQRARQGLSTTRHAGVWLAGGYKHVSRTGTIRGW